MFKHGIYTLLLVLIFCAPLAGNAANDQPVSVIPQPASARVAPLGSSGVGYLAAQTTTAPALLARTTPQPEAVPTQIATAPQTHAAANSSAQFPKPQTSSGLTFKKFGQNFTQLLSSVALPFGAHKAAKQKASTQDLTKTQWILLIILIVVLAVVLGISVSRILYALLVVALVLLILILLGVI